jgi:ABC-2 type transport system ATP-binding protein
MGIAIEVKDIKKNYGRIAALRGLSLSVPEGEIFGLLGANGAGKSTLIQLLVGALKPDSGKAEVLGLDPQKQKHELRLKLGYMPQQAALYDDLTARDNVRFFGKARDIPNLENRIGEVLDFLRLGDRANDPVYGFSGGMKQRLSLACALVHKPKLLLLDEPSTGVDPKLRDSLWEHFHELTHQGVSILISTHQMDEALHCDRVAVMRGGLMLACDAPRKLLATGRAKVTLWNGDACEEHVFSNYRAELPKLLGIENRFSKIEVQEDTLEEVVLRLIAEKDTLDD